jgi:Amt family ammonium transporter
MGWWHDRVLHPEKSITGLLGGLVAVTAGCAVLNGSGRLDHRRFGRRGCCVERQCVGTLRRIDDAVGAIGVHGFAGVVGTIGLAFLAPASSLPLDNRFDQAMVQLFGVGLNFVWAFGLGYLAFLAIAKFSRLRVAASSEDVGLNDTEHGTRIGIGHVEDAFGRLVDGEADLSLRLGVDEGDEAERLARLFNALMDSIESQEMAKGAVADKRRAEEEAERLSALANATFEAIVICVDGRVIDGNAALEALIGGTLDDLAKGARCSSASIRRIKPFLPTGSRQQRVIPTRYRSCKKMGPSSRWKCARGKSCTAASQQRWRPSWICANARSRRKRSAIWHSMTR